MLFGKGRKVPSSKIQATEIRAINSWDSPEALCLPTAEFPSSLFKKNN